MQCEHAQNVAARRDVQLCSPALLYDMGCLRDFDLQLIDCTVSSASCGKGMASRAGACRQPLLVTGGLFTRLVTWCLKCGLIVEELRAESDFLLTHTVTSAGICLLGSNLVVNLSTIHYFRCDLQD